MNNKLISKITLSLLISVSIISGCKKEEVLSIPPTQAHFADKTIGSYYIENTPASTYKVPIGVTTVSDVARKVTVTVTSPTGAVAGTHYNIPSTTVTIPAGKAIDTLTVNGLFSGYATNRVDTLTFTISGGDVAVSDYNSTFKLVLRKYCPVSLTTLSGNYTKTFDIEQPPVYGPYLTNVVATNNITVGTTDTIRINNFFDYGGYILVRLDWTDPANFRTTVLDGQTTLGFVHPTYGNVLIRSAGNGTFSSCDNVFDIRFNLYVTAGSFGNFYTQLKR